MYILLNFQGTCYWNLHRNRLKGCFAVKVLNSQYNYIEDTDTITYEIVLKRHAYVVKYGFSRLELNLPVPIPDEEKKLSWIFIFTLVYGASKGFMKALKAS